MSTVYSLFQYLFECMKKGLKMTKEKKPVIDELSTQAKKKRRKKSKKYPFVSYCFLLVHSFAYFSCFVFCHFESNCYGNNIMFQFSGLFMFLHRKNRLELHACVYVLEQASFLSVYLIHFTAFFLLFYCLLLNVVEFSLL